MEKYIYVKDKIGQYVRKDIQEVFDILSKWFAKLQNGTHVLTIIDPFAKSKLSKQEINDCIEELDKDFEQYESWRVRRGKILNEYNKNIVEDLPKFNRLCPNARRAMVQELYKLFDYQRDHLEEYLEPYTEYEMEDSVYIPLHF